MQIIWDISDADVDKVRSFLAKQEASQLVRRRIARNLVGPAPDFTREYFWHIMMACLLTTQQKSGPDAPITRFLHSDPFPLAYAICCETDQTQAFVASSLQAAGGIRRFNVIAAEATRNLEWLQSGHWDEIEEKLSALRGTDNLAIERSVARYVAERLAGFGPKQARNLLQILGLTKHEIPLDSRVMKWLRDFGFPLPVSSQVLSDPDVYEFVLDGVQALCRRCGLYPCVLDAAIFAGFDGDGWNEVESLW